ncbi:MAG TPA: hypothetical protein DD416_07635 [Rhodobacteraceae bacterium]|nr:hypothetical protein [Paracoccaceae bacterium]
MRRVKHRLLADPVTAKAKVFRKFCCFSPSFIKTSGQISGPRFGLKGLQNLCAAAFGTQMISQCNQAIAAFCRQHSGGSVWVGENPNLILPQKPGLGTRCYFNQVHQACR